jgi:hypothetical protein
MSIPVFTNWLFGLDQSQIWWYITRSAGLVAYLLLWFSTAWGVAVPSKIFSPKLTEAFTFEFHQHLSWLALGFTGLHFAVLLVDRNEPFSLVQTLIPFTSTYRPLWVGIGVIGMYLSLIVSMTYYLRRRIGIRAFRAIHLLGFAAFVGAALHGWFAGTDSGLLSMKVLYGVSFLSVVFLTAFWLAGMALRKFTPRAAAPVRVRR